MELKRVTSSNLYAVGYDEIERVLFIQFRNGVYYKYEDVPFEVYDGMLQSASVGKYFNTFVRDKFAFKKLNGETND